MKPTYISLLLFVVFCSFSTLLAQEESYGIDKSIFFNGGISNYKDVRFLYFNILQYDGNRYQPPFPYVDGRVRNGKYKASASAMESYVKSLDKYNGKAFSILKIDESNGSPSLVMACENKDTLVFDKNIIQGQFIREDFYRNVRKKIGSKVYYASGVANGNFIDNLPNYQKELFKYFIGFTNLKTGEKETYLPYLSHWTIKDVRYDRKYIGERNSTNDELNTELPVRIKYTIENPDYGTYEIFPFNQEVSFSNDLISFAPFEIDPSFTKKEMAKMEEWANKGFVEALFTKSWVNNEYIENGTVPQACIISAKKGYIIAVDAILNANDVKNVSIDDMYSMLNAAKQRYGADYRYVYLDIQLEKKKILKNYETQRNKSKISEIISKINNVGYKYEGAKAQRFKEVYLDILNLYVIPERNKMLKQSRQSRASLAFYDKLLMLYDQELELVKAYYDDRRDDSFYSWTSNIITVTRYLQVTKDIVEFNKEKKTNKGSSPRDFDLKDKIYDLVFLKDAYMEQIIPLIKKGCRENGANENYGIYFEDVVNTRLPKALKSASQTDMKMVILELINELYIAAKDCGRDINRNNAAQVEMAIEVLKDSL